MLTYDTLRRDAAVNTYITRADESLSALGFTEHSFPHVCRVAEVAGEILRVLGYDDHEIELARIAAYLHDIGNLVNRVDHSQSGAVMAFRILDHMDMDPADVATGKIKREAGGQTLTLRPTEDIAAALGRMKRPEQRLVGFALETDHELENARGKLARKGLDFIVLNSLRDAGAGFRHDTNKISIISATENIPFPLKNKKEVAKDIVNYLASLL